VAVSTASLTGALRQIVGAEACIDDPGALTAAAIDEVAPRWLVRPTRVEQVAAVLGLAREEGLAVAPRGSGSALALGWPLSRLDLVLELGALKAVLEHHADDLTVAVQVGLTAGELHDAVLKSHRQWLPVDPPGWPRRTLGGIIATNASGPLRTRYGTMRDLLLGVRFVQADGVVTWGGARVVKSVTGYDIPKLMVGSLGTVGVLVDATLRLHPRPDVERTWLLAFRSPRALADGVAAALDSPLQPSRLEVLDAAALRAVGLPPAPVALAVAVASVEEAVRAQGEALTRMAATAGATITPLEPDLWQTPGWTLPRDAGAVVLQAASLPSRLADTLDAISGSAEPLGAQATMLVTGQAAIGVFRVTVTGAEIPALGAMIARLRDRLAEAGGHVIVQRGPRRLREQVDPWGALEPTALDLMREVKATFDPTGVLNPGRFVGRL
jgi:glycolate oxidase FAD binding subunit